MPFKITHKHFGYAQKFYNLKIFSLKLKNKIKCDLNKVIKINITNTKNSSNINYWLIRK